MRSHPTGFGQRPSFKRPGLQQGNARVASLAVFLGLAVLGAVIFFEPDSENPPPHAEPGSEEVTGVPDTGFPDAKGPDWLLPTGSAGAQQGSDAGVPAARSLPGQSRGST